MIVEDIKRRIQWGYHRTLTRSDDKTSVQIDHIEHENKDTNSESDISRKTDVKIIGNEESVAKNMNTDGSTEVNELNDSGILPISSNIQILLLQKCLEIMDSSDFSKLTQRDLVVLVSLSSMYESGLLSKNNTLSSGMMLLHTAILSESRLSDRLVHQIKMPAVGAFLEDFIPAAVLVLKSEFWGKKVVNRFSCDLADLVDGRLLSYIFNRKRITHDHFQPSVISKFHMLSELLEALCGVKIKMIYSNLGRLLKNPIIFSCGSETEKRKNKNDRSKHGNTQDGKR